MTNSLLEKLKIPIPGKPLNQPSELASFAMWMDDLNSRKVMPFRKLMASIHQVMSSKKAESRMTSRAEVEARRFVARFAEGRLNLALRGLG